MTRLEMQKEIVKQFRRRFRREFGNVKGLYDVSYKFYACGGDLVSITYESDCSGFTVYFDDCLNISLSTLGCAMLGITLELAIKIANDVDNYIHWLLSKDKIHSITFNHE